MFTMSLYYKPVESVRSPHMFLLSTLYPTFYCGSGRANVRPFLFFCAYCAQAGEGDCLTRQRGIPAHRGLNCGLRGRLAGKRGQTAFFPSCQSPLFPFPTAAAGRAESPVPASFGGNPPKRIRGTSEGIAHSRFCLCVWPRPVHPARRECRARVTARARGRGGQPPTRLPFEGSWHGRRP